MAGRGQDRRRGRRCAQRALKSRQVRLRRADSRARGRRSLHAAHPAQAARPALPLRVRHAEHGRRRARSRRGVRARLRRASGRHRARTCSANTSAARRSCWSPIPAIARRRTCRQVRCRRSRRPIAAALKGKKLPLVGRIEITVIEEGQAMWLAFANRELDLLERAPGRFRRRRRSSTASSGPSSPPRASGTRCCCGRTRAGPTSTWRTRSSAATRRRRSRCAARSAWATTSSEFIRVILKGRGVPAMGPIPPDVAGYDPKLKTAAQLYDPAAARALLDRFGYKDRDGDGYRETPGRQAARARALVAADARSRGRRTSSGRRTWTRSASGSCSRRTGMPGAAQDGAAGQDPDAHRRLERRLSGRREFHAAPVRAERRPGEPRALQPAGIRQALRRGAPAARFARAHARSSTG